MAQPTTLRSSKMLIELGDGASPEVFSTPCALATKNFGRSTTSNDFSVADCDDPDAPRWAARAKAALSSTITASGTLPKESIDVYDDFFESEDSRNVRVILDYPISAGGPRVYQGSYLMTQFNLGAEESGLIQVDIELQSNGAVVLVP